MEESPEGLSPVQKKDITITVEAHSAGKMRKEARVTSARGETFTLACDESAHLGGENTAPPPLAYFSASIAF